MKNFKQGSKFGGDRGSSGQDFARKGFRDRSSGGRDFGGRDRDTDRPMYDAVCAECGKKCQVPFRPSGDKPVYCNTCFGSKKGGETRSFDKRESRGSSFGDRPERQMFSTTCSECGNKCEVPFRPTGDKPVYCSECFGKNNDRGERSGSGNRDASNKNNDGQFKNQLDALNAKLDKILKLLSPAPEGIKEIKEPTPEKIEKVETKKIAKIEKPTPKKPPTKKVSTKKKK